MDCLHLRWSRAVACSFALAALFVMTALSSAPVAAQTCTITGPTSVAANASFTLCGQAGSGLTYEWYGPGLTSSTTSRCVSASGLSSGGYEFLLVRRQNGVEVDRCVLIVNVGGSSGGTSSCRISGPTTITSGSTATLCAPNDGIHTYHWTGPNGFTASTSCITVSQGGTYTLNSRNPFTGSSRNCTHLLQVTGTPGDNYGDCLIQGPEVIDAGTTARLCAPSRANTSYRWTGPNGFTATARCVTVSGTGEYTVTLRDLSTGEIDRCTRLLAYSDDVPPDSDPDAPYAGNCPRDLQFWRQALNGKTPASTGLTTADLQVIAREVDRRSNYFNWTNDVTGLRSALSPGGTLTRRKQIARQYASLLANVSASELGVGDVGDGAIGIDPDTQVSFANARTVGELIALTDRWLRENRGDFAKLNATLNQVNRGMGIGPTCNGNDNY